MDSPYFRAACALLLWAAAAGCDGFGSDLLGGADGGSTNSGTSDSGFSEPADAGRSTDSGRAPDASTATDASQGIDASPGTDASPGSDASSAPDAGPDAGQPDSGSGGSDGGSVPLPCTSLPLCEGFETAAVGGPPDSNRWTLAWKDCQGTTQIAIDGSEAHSGSRSAKVTGKGGFCNHLFLSNTSAPLALGSNFYARFWVRFSAALGDEHVTFAAMSDATDGKDLRMGGQSKILMYNRELDDATLPALSPTGIGLSVKPSPLVWHCMEFHIDGSQGVLQTWFDGAEVAALQLDSTPTPDVDNQWLNGKSWRPSLKDFRLGWESYGGSDMTLWFDDVALGSARIGCQ
jgi:hypothetical protein